MASNQVQDQGYNPSSIDSLPAVLDEFLKSHDIDVQACIPAVVQSYNRDDNTIIVRPAVRRTWMDDTNHDSPVVKVNPLVLHGGGLMINFPIQPGDTGWLIAADRDTASFKSNLAVSNPSTNRHRRYEHGFFIPDKIQGYNISPEDNGALVIQTLDGVTKVVIRDGQIDIVGSNVNIRSDILTIDSPSMIFTGDLLFTGNTTFTGNNIFNGQTTHNGNYILTGALNVAGVVTVTAGDVIVIDPVTSSPISHLLHLHSSSNPIYSGYTNIPSTNPPTP